MGETRNRAEVIGFHNWIQFYLQEKQGLVDYKGFFPSRRVSNSCITFICDNTFAHKNVHAHSLFLFFFFFFQNAV